MKQIITKESYGSFSQKPYFVFDGKWRITNALKEFYPGGVSEERFINHQEELTYQLCGMWLGGDNG
jgi:hypothetical protein